MTGALSYLVIGVDPGPTPGICALYWPDRGDFHDFDYHPIQTVIQANAEACPGLVMYLRDKFKADHNLLAMERFVVSSRAGRSGTPKAGQVTRALLGALAEVWGPDSQVQRSAAEVKPWASDKRLDKIGLLQKCTGMPHSRDAARHALFAGVKDFGKPDPLSARYLGMTVTG
jgi:hypothetical protein